jgi:hypothetical protein
VGEGLSRRAAGVCCRFAEVDCECLKDAWERTVERMAGGLGVGGSEVRRSRDAGEAFVSFRPREWRVLQKV